jgi:hypothetical protein
LYPSVVRVAMEFNDGVEYSNLEDFSTSDLTNIENDGEEYGAESTSTPSVERRGLKRDHGMCGDSGAAVQPERRLRSRIQEQFALLRAVVPNLRTVSTHTNFHHSPDTVSVFSDEK